MGSKGMKRKKVDNEIVAENVDSELPEKKRSKKSKKSKNGDELTPTEETPAKRVEGTHEYPEESSGIEETKKTKKIRTIKKSTKSKKMTPTEEAYSTDTLAERRARKKAARQPLVMDAGPKDKLADLLAQKEQREESRKLAISKIVPATVSLDNRHIEDTKVDDRESDGANTSDREEPAASISIPRAKQAEEVSKKAQVGPSQTTRYISATEIVKTDIQPAIVNKTSPPGVAKFSNKAELAIRPSLSQNTTTFCPPTGPRRLLRMERVVSAAQHTLPAALFAHPQIHSARLHQMGYDEPPSRLHKTTVNSAGSTERGVDSHFVSIERQCIAGIVGDGECKLREIEQETGAKIHLDTNINTRDFYVRGRITGSQEAISKAKGRIFQAEAALRHPHQFVTQSNASLRQIPRSSASMSSNLQQQQEQRVLQSEGSHAPWNARDIGSTITRLPLLTKPPGPVSIRSPVIGRLNEGLDVFAACTKSKGNFESAFSSETSLPRSHTHMQDFQRVVEQVKQKASGLASSSRSTHGPESIQKETLRCQLPGKEKSAVNVGRARLNNPADASVIRTEDSSKSVGASTIHSPHTLPPSSKCDDPNTAEASSPSLDMDYQAILNDRKNRIQKAERECRLLKYMLDYLGVSEMQMELFQNRCNRVRNGSWDKNCLAVLGRARVEKE